MATPLTCWLASLGASTRVHTPTALSVHVYAHFGKACPAKTGGVVLVGLFCLCDFANTSTYVLTADRYALFNPVGLIGVYNVGFVLDPSLVFIPSMQLGLRDHPFGID